MAERPNLDHIFVAGVTRNETSTRRGSGDPKIRPVEDRIGHATRLRREAEQAANDFTTSRSTVQLEELRSLGVIVTIRAVSADYPLKLESFDSWTRHRDPADRLPRWQLLTVTTSDDGSETAVVWIADTQLPRFFKLFNDYQTETLQPSKKFPNGHPKNDELVANMSTIAKAVARDLWTSKGEPPTERRWWELVIRGGDAGLELVRRIGGAIGFRVAPEALVFDDRTIVWIDATWSTIETLVLTAVPLHEVRRPSRVGSVLESTLEDQDDYVSELAARVSGSSEEAVAICLLDTGVLSQHVLLQPHLDASSVHSAVPPDPTGDRRGHGTLMAGLALYGDLQPLFESSTSLTIGHRLESVKVLPDATANASERYALVTARAVALPELARPSRRRVFNLAITAIDEPIAGEPTSWSAAVDAIAAGADIDQLDDGTVRLLTKPDSSLSRLFVVAAGNVRDTPQPNYLDRADISGVETPGQAWNCLTVGAYTDRATPPIDPAMHGWLPLADGGELSPHSRTSVGWARQWAIKPDIVCEGGNVLLSGQLFDSEHPSVSLTSTSSTGLMSIGHANATSAASALAANIAARVITRYPTAWPETVRALLVHSASWTEPMRSRFEPANKRARLALLRRYGWGVPNDDRALASFTNAATLIIQDEFRPFDGTEHKIVRFRMHDLPWPVRALADLGEADVRLRVSLSYFIEPTVSHRGWRTRYAYASHGLRFELKRPLETDDAFTRRINNTAEHDENGDPVPSSAEDAQWYLGPQQRDRGSLIADIWTGTAASLADCDKIAVRATGGWWKYNRRADRMDQPVRYALVMSLETEAENVDLYAAIATALPVPVPVPVPIAGRPNRYTGWASSSPHYV
jgi:Subtilase family